MAVIPTAHAYLHIINFAPEVNTPLETPAETLDVEVMEFAITVETNPLGA